MVIVHVESWIIIKVEILFNAFYWGEDMPQYTFLEKHRFSINWMKAILCLCLVLFSVVIIMVVPIIFLLANQSRATPLYIYFVLSGGYALWCFGIVIRILFPYYSYLKHLYNMNRIRISKTKIYLTKKNNLIQILPFSQLQSISIPESIEKSILNPQNSNDCIQIIKKEYIQLFFHDNIYISIPFAVKEFNDIAYFFYNMVTQRTACQLLDQTQRCDNHNDVCL